MDIEAIASQRDIRDAVEWGYWLILGRDETDQEIIRQHTQSFKTIAEVRQAFLQSDEFLNRGQSIKDDLFALFKTAPAISEDGFFIDFLGTRTRCSYLPSSLSRLSGKVFGYPGSNNDELHEQGEWLGTLRSVLEAKPRGKLVVGELGAGWGPWLVIAAKAAASIDISDVRLIGVEASTAHIAFLNQHLRDNGIDPVDHTILHSIIGLHDGFAYFPMLEKANEDWGGQAEFEEVGNHTHYEKVTSICLSTLATSHPPFDLLHCDIQGAEGDVLPASADMLNTRVRRIVVGTHSREIEGRLFKFFGSAGWRLELEQSCRYDGELNLLTDGVQVWSNPSEIFG